MKTYLTWELLKMAEEAEPGNKRTFTNKDGRIVQFGKSCVARGLSMPNTGLMCEGIMVNEEWTEVQQEVPFLEAIKAYHERKIVSCEFDGKRTIFNPFKYFKSNEYPVDSEKCVSVTTGEILNGKWFIEENESEEK